MKLSVQEIASLVGGSLVGEGRKTIEGAAGLEEARNFDVSFLKDANDKNTLALFHSTNAGCVFVPKGFANGKKEKTVIEVDHSLGAFVKILELIEIEKKPVTPGIDRLAYVAPTASIGKNVTIGPFAVVEAGVSIGDGARVDAHVYVGQRSVIGPGTHLYPHVTIREECVIGSRCILHSGSVIGADGFGFYFSQGKNIKIPQIGNVVIEDDVEIGAGTTIDRATTGSTRIGQGTKIDNLVQVAHNVEVGELSLIVAQVGIGGSCKIGKGVILAGQVGVADHIHIGDGVQVAGQSGVITNIPDKQVVWGLPAISRREKIREIIALKKLPDLIKKLGLIKK